MTRIKPFSTGAVYKKEKNDKHQRKRSFTSLSILITVFDLITAPTPISAKSIKLVVFRLQAMYLIHYKSTYCGYPLELHQQVNAIQMGIHNICFYEENQNGKLLKHSISIIRAQLFKANDVVS